MTQLRYCISSYYKMLTTDYFRQDTDINYFFPWENVIDLLLSIYTLDQACVRGGEMEDGVYGNRQGERETKKNKNTIHTRKLYAICKYI